MSNPLTRAAMFLVLTLIAGVFFSALGGCAPESGTETNSFERAEIAYRRGDYKRALRGYERFLQQHPYSPLARVARQRIRCLNREVQAMLGRHGMPRPIYLPPSQKTTTDATPEKNRPTPTRDPATTPRKQPAPRRTPTPPRRPAATDINRDDAGKPGKTPAPKMVPPPAEP